MRGGTGGSVPDRHKLALRKADLPELEVREWPVPEPEAARPRERIGLGDLPIRIVSASVLAPLALLCIWLGGAAWVALVAFGFLGMAAEWVALCGRRVLAWPGIAVPLGILAAGAATAVGRPGLGLGLLAAGAVLSWAAARGTGRASRLAAGVLYVGLAAVALLWLRRSAAGRADVLFLALVVWASDVGAYSLGRLLGGPKLAPRISPSKTWAGALGGLLAATAVGLCVAAGFGDGAGRAALVAAGLGLAAQAGDLLESGLKRRFGVKDSGRLIPGHGGLLDRVDGVLAAAPAAALLALALGGGVPIWR
ncbi:MAG: phosphatidate cytidylyltransferase [Acidisphaera sp.]|nr:phosphatidate cytidylyltransferase [Acidisphaera sp.]